VISDFEREKLKIKRFQKLEGSDVNETLLGWSKQDRIASVPVSSPILITIFIFPKFLFKFNVFLT